MVDGKFLMKNREFLTLDVEKIAADAMLASKKVWEKYNSLD